MHNSTSTHPTPDQRRAQAEAQATELLDSKDWPQLQEPKLAFVDIEARHHKPTDLPAERHAELIETLRMEGSALRNAMVRQMLVRIVLWPIVLLCIYLIAGTARAQETRLVLHQLSYHFDRGTPFNEVNPGLGVQYRPSSRLPSLGDERAASPLADRALASGYVQAGFYKNSFRQRTLYVAAGTEPFAWGPVRLGGALGLATGYRTRTTVTTEVMDGQTVIVTRRRQRGGVILMGFSTASVPLGDTWTAHFAVTPTIKADGTTHNYGAIALVLSARI